MARRNPISRQSKRQRRNTRKAMRPDPRRQGVVKLKRTFDHQDALKARVEPV